VKKNADVSVDHIGGWNGHSVVASVMRSKAINSRIFRKQGIIQNPVAFLVVRVKK
jgi:hypothetical protein